MRAIREGVVFEDASGMRKRVPRHELMDYVTDPDTGEPLPDVVLVVRAECEVHPAHGRVLRLCCPVCGVPILKPDTIATRAAIHEHCLPYRIAGPVGDVRRAWL